MTKSHEMKKFYLLSGILVFLLQNCDSNSSNSANSTSIVGTWKITERTLDGTDVPLGECEPENTYTYNGNGTYLYKLYSADEGSSACLDNPFEEFTGTWTKNFDGTYKFTDSNNEESTYEIKFMSNSEFYYEYTEFSSDTDPTIVTVKETFKKQ